MARFVCVLCDLCGSSLHYSVLENYLITLATTRSGELSVLILSGKAITSNCSTSKSAPRLVGFSKINTPSLRNIRWAVKGERSGEGRSIPTILGFLEIINSANSGWISGWPKKYSGLHTFGPSQYKIR